MNIHERECCLCPFDKLSCAVCKIFSETICKEENDPFANIKFHSANSKNFESKVLKYLREKGIFSAEQTEVSTML